MSVINLNSEHHNLVLILGKLGNQYILLILASQSYNGLVINTYYYFMNQVDQNTDDALTKHGAWDLHTHTKLVWCFVSTYVRKSS